MSTPAPQPALGWRRRLLRELRLGLGLLLGLGFLLHPSWVRFGYPHGADWDTYLGSAAHLWLDPELYRYNEWRQPMYPWLVGLLGTGSSYVLAAQYLALVSSVGTVLGATVMGRALAGPWAAGLAALSTAFLTVVVDGSWWVNPYPLVGSLTAVSLALAACCARWPRLGLALLAGVLAGLCWAADPRGLPVAAAVPLLVLLPPVVARRRALLVGLALLGIAGGKGLDYGLREHYQLELRPLRSQLSLQRQESWGPNAPRDDLTVNEERACSQGADARLGLTALAGPCAVQRRALNLKVLRQREHLPPVWPAVALLLLCLVPASWGRRSTLAAALVFLPSTAALFVGISWVPYVDRYLLPSAALLGALGPVALVLLGSLVARRWARWRWLGGLGLLMSTLWVFLVWPGVHPGDLLHPLDHMARRETEKPAPVDARQALAAWARSSIGPDDLVVDCAELHLAILLLPRRLPVWDAPPHHHMCHVRMKDPPPAPDGELWLLTVHQRGRKPDPRLKSPDWVRARGWEERPLELDIPPDTHAATIAGWLRRWRWPE